MDGSGCSIDSMQDNMEDIKILLQQVHSMILIKSEQLESKMEALEQRLQSVEQSVHVIFPQLAIIQQQLLYLTQLEQEA